MLKLLAFNASPRRSEGTTDILVDRFIEGAGEAGAETEKHHVVDLDVNGCLGCFSCWWKTPGRCVQRDDMDWILPAINESDILVLGTPVYGRNVTHHLQRLVERTFLNSLPEMHVEDGATRHPRRTKKIPRLVLVSTCGFPDLANFDHMIGLYPTALHILLPASQLLLNDEGRGYLSEFLDAVGLAGRTIAREEEISGDLRERLIVDYPEDVKKLIVDRHNAYFASLSPTG
jgi:hypothetical protein